MATRSRKQLTADEASELVEKSLRRWQRLWHVPGLARETTVGFSKRLRATLGRSVPAERRISLREVLLHWPEQRLVEVLCHEAAHVAIYMK